LHNVGLSPGSNELVLRGVDQWGNTKKEAKFLITKPVAPTKAAAAK